MDRDRERERKRTCIVRHRYMYTYMRKLYMDRHDCGYQLSKGACFFFLVPPILPTRAGHTVGCPKEDQAAKSLVQIDVACLTH